MMSLDVRRLTRRRARASTVRPAHARRGPSVPVFGRPAVRSFGTIGRRLSPDTTRRDPSVELRGSAAGVGGDVTT